jgi:prepilin-type N-terminal cleavage/methylation domain-containing protein
MNKNKNRGFSLVELLVVIAIIGILSSIVIASISAAREKALKTKTKASLDILRNQISVAQGEKGLTLLSITGSGCSECGCRGIGDLRNIATSSSCYVSMSTALTKILVAADAGYTSSSDLIRDPWGSPYLIDENEGEGSPTNCSRDSLRSAGPNGSWGDSDDILPTAPLTFAYCQN